MGSLSWLSRSDLAGLACPYCGRTANADDEAMVAAEAAWGFVGATLTLRGGRTAALLVAPVPETRSAQLCCLWVAPGQVGQGHGKRLIQSTAAGLLSRDIEAILARGSRAGAHCTAPPSDFLRAVGFTRALDERTLGPSRALQFLAQAELDGTRLWRLDLTTAATTPQGLRELVEHWLRAWRPIGPEPAGRVSRKS